MVWVTSSLPELHAAGEIVRARVEAYHRFLDTAPEIDPQLTEGFGDIGAGIFEKGWTMIAPPGKAADASDLESWFGREGVERQQHQEDWFGDVRIFGEVLQRAGSAYAGHFLLQAEPTFGLLEFTWRRYFLGGLMRLFTFSADCRDEKAVDLLHEVATSMTGCDESGYRVEYLHDLLAFYFTQAAFKQVGISLAIELRFEAADWTLKSHLRDVEVPLLRERFVAGRRLNGPESADTFSDDRPKIIFKDEFKRAWSEKHQKEFALWTNAGLGKRLLTNLYALHLQNEKAERMHQMRELVPWGNLSETGSYKHAGDWLNRRHKQEQETREFLQDILNLKNNALAFRGFNPAYQYSVE